MEIVVMSTVYPVSTHMIKHSNPLFFNFFIWQKKSKDREYAAFTIQLIKTR